MKSFLKKVNMIILFQPYIEKAIEFYTKLGLKLLFHIPNQWAEFQLGEVKIGLYQIDETLPERRPGIVFEVDDVQHMYDELQNEVAFIGKPVEKPHGIMVSFKDPGGNILDLYQPTPEKLKAYLDSLKKEQEESQ